MSNVAEALKNEMARIARKEIKRETEALKRSAAGYRHEIAALKRRIQDLEGQLRKLGKPGPAAAEPGLAPEAETPNLRFSAPGFASLRQRLGLSAIELGQLLGVSAMSVYKWEQGKARPRARFLPSIAAIRAIGRREAQERLQAIAAAAPPST